MSGQNYWASLMEQFPEGTDIVNVFQSLAFLFNGKKPSQIFRRLDIEKNTLYSAHKFIEKLRRKDPKEYLAIREIVLSSTDFLVFAKLHNAFDYSPLDIEKFKQLHGMSDDERRRFLQDAYGTSKKPNPRGEL
ncbi:MAG: hypothetical protein AAF583_03545 [Pseudomonadota bacterium]